MLHLWVVSYLYAINANSQEPIFQINQHIGFDDDIVKDGEVIQKGDGQGIDGGKFAREVFEIDSLQPRLLTFFHNSQGGDIKHGFDMFNAITVAKSKTKSVIAGFCCSTDGWVALAADIVEMYDYSVWMCHMVSEANGKESPLVSITSKNVSKIIADKSGRNGKAKKSPEEILELMRAKTYYTADEMYNIGLIDRVLESGGKIKKIALLNFDNAKTEKTEYSKYQTFLNKIIFNDNINTNYMSEKLNNKLGLVDGSDENARIAAVANLENKIKFLNEEKTELDTKIKILNQSQEENQKRMIEMQNNLTNLQNSTTSKASEYDTLKNEMDMLKNKYDLMCQEKDTLMNKEKERESAAFKEKCEKLVNHHAELGRIKSDDTTKTRWVNRALDNYENTELDLETLPSNVHVPVLVNKDEIETLQNEHVNPILNKFRNESREKYQTEKASAEQRFLNANK